MEYTAKFLTAIQDIDHRVWDEIAFNATPFMQHAFLNALEVSGCVHRNTGWQPCHMIIVRAEKPVAILPLYIKYHSHGEYVFDSEWAKAYQRYEMYYYPKLLSSIPFTPVTGPRLAVKSSESSKSIYAFVVEQIQSLCRTQGFSSWHCLFTPAHELEQWQSTHLVKRSGVQFHWFNKGYETFEHYLRSMNSKKRKMVKRERRLTQEQNIEHRWIQGNDMTPSNWHDFYHCYSSTYVKRGQAPYLNLTFFKQIAQSMSKQVFCLMAIRDNKTIACALYLANASTLYGRYWGSIEEENCLHFETCYYQGIDYAIKHGLKYFDAGAQGEHKISRGFEPVEISSWHWIQAPEFRTAITAYIARETEILDDYQTDCAALLPFKKK